MSESEGIGLTRDEWSARLLAVGDHLAASGSKAQISLLGSVPNILAGQPDRLTMDLDVWKAGSSFSAPHFRRAVESAGLLYNPTGAVDPDLAYVQIVNPGIVQMGEFEALEIEQFGALQVCQPPAENLIASKLCRASASDLHDIAWMMAAYKADAEQVRRIIATFPRVQRGTATENLIYLDALVPSDEVPGDTPGGKHEDAGLKEQPPRPSPRRSKGRR